MKRLMVAGVLMLSACGGGGGSSNPTPVTTTPPAPIEGRVVLGGEEFGGSFTLSSSPTRLSRSFSGCGDATITVYYRETAGGTATGADYEVQVLDINGVARRTTGIASNIGIPANGIGVITFTERNVCVEWTDELPPRGSVAINFAGPRGTVSQVAANGPLSIIQ